MSIDGPSPPGALVSVAMPWWLGRGVGLALVLVVGAVAWAFAWDIATYVATPPSPVAQRYEADEVVLSAVSGTSTTTADHRPLGGRPAPGTSTTTADHKPQGGRQASGTSAAVAAPRPGQQADGGQSRRTSSDQVLRAEALEERERARARARRAIRADRELAAFIKSVRVLDERELWTAPLRAGYRITATFGQAGSLWSNDHTGVDLAAPTGTPVASVAAGTVTHASRAGAYGLKVEVRHADGTVTGYSHLSRIGVTVGALIEEGTSIGAVGTTGNSTGPHLHLELRPDGGAPVDPVAALAARGVQL